MNLDTFVAILKKNLGEPLHLMLPNGEFVPAHFHITEVGRIQKDFIDCGGTIRSVTNCLLQVWAANDTQHRLDTTKLDKIIQLGNKMFPSLSIPIEVEYEGSIVSQYPLTEVEMTPSGLLLHLGSKHTACLAQDRCGVVSLPEASCCAPGCC